MTGAVYGRPDRLELAIRFVCGFLAAGWVVGRVTSVGGLLAGLVVGLLAAWYGDAFWATLARFLPWRR
jgi:fructose-specific phosphotransferase system IIC component